MTLGRIFFSKCTIMPFRWKDWALPLIGVTCLCGLVSSCAWCTLQSLPDESQRSNAIWSIVAAVAVILAVPCVLVIVMSRKVSTV